jgi:hypothetical protein
MNPFNFSIDVVSSVREGIHRRGIMVRIAMLAVMMVATANVQASAQESGYHMMFAQGSHSWSVDASASKQVSTTRVIYAVGCRLLVTVTERDAMVGTDFDGVMGWIDNYRRAHPLNAIAFAVHELFDELQSRPPRR